MDRSLPKSLPLECHFYPVRQWNADLGHIQVFPLPCCQEAQTFAWCNFLTNVHMVTILRNKCVWKKVCLLHCLIPYLEVLFMTIWSNVFFIKTDISPTTHLHLLKIKNLLLLLFCVVFLANLVQHVFINIQSFNSPQKYM